MAVTYVWPATLPQAVGVDYSESVGSLIIRTPTDSGAAKQRRRGNRPDVLRVSFYMTPAQVETLRTFISATTKGTARFGFPHPRTGTQAEVRMVPQDDGQLFTCDYAAPDCWSVAMTLEVLP